MSRRPRGASRSLVGVAAVCAGLAIAAWAQVASPLARPPLYDGVVVADPYRYLQPPPGQRGNPGTASTTVPVQGGSHGIVAVGTPEYPPQAQIFASGGAFTLPAGTTSILVDIRAVPPPEVAPAGQLAGNVYRMTVTTQDGIALTAPASARVSIVLRAPEGVQGAVLQRFDGHAWHRLETSAETSGMFLAVATEFGDFALVVPGAGSVTGPPAGSSPAAAGGTAASGAGGQATAPPVQTPESPAGETGGIPPLVLVVLVGVLIVGLVAFGLTGR